MSLLTKSYKKKNRDSSYLDGPQQVGTTAFVFWDKAATGTACFSTEYTRADKTVASLNHRTAKN